jgi:single-strand DNA-binding protein
VVFSQGLVGIVKNYVKKGSKLYIEGQLQTRKWTDKDGADKYTTEIVLQGFNSTIQLVGGKGLQDAGIDKALDVVDKSKTNGFQSEDDMDDSVPF